ncbi:SurA N-terminal domain-containing protein [Bacillus sp. V3B]|uniref:SurA N-terminal domain-containing protein n=1 Tax=Bacillus sp. V3B TaxID=2804915 RepID=UPI00210B514C|nr:SurA N-terminal domain-containing protein [Bacillus sp. V3B]MCQ6275473.1 SurA N-terminal domain-containing protein [Bacillus sp. V3B]
MLKRISSFFILLGVTALILGACSSGNSGEGKTTKKSEIVATVNDNEILKEDYDNQLELTKASYEEQGLDLANLDSKELEQSVLDQLINTELLLQTAQDKGISIKQSEIDSELNNIKSQFEDEEQYKEALEESMLTEETLEEQFRDQLLITEYIDSNIDDSSVSEDEVKAIYEQYKEQALSQQQEIPDFETIKPQMEEQAIAQKKEQKVSELIEDLRKTNEKNIEILF